jgi:hypothetical protein
MNSSLVSFDQDAMHDLALRTLAEKVTPCIGPFIEEVSRQYEVPSVSVAPTKPDCDLCTWICEPGLFFTLVMMYPNQPSYIVDNLRNVVYTATLTAQLSSQCPEKTAFIGQFVLDKTPDGNREPHLLVFDVVCPGLSPTQRYEKLRSMEHFLPKPLCCVQWAGERQCMSKDFLKSLPHDVAGLVWLGSGDDVFSVGGVEFLDL